MHSINLSSYLAASVKIKPVDHLKTFPINVVTYTIPPWRGEEGRGEDWRAEKWRESM